VSLVDSVRRLAQVLQAMPPPFGPRVLRPPVPASDALDDVPDPYQAFLRLADGAECGPAGEMRLASVSELRSTQWMANDLPGGPDRWCVVGDVLQNPVCIDRATGQMWWFADLNIVWHTDTDLRTFAKATDDFPTYLDHVILGAGYADLVATDRDDPWTHAILSATRQWS
jgi:hypothetical protein